MPTQGEAWTYQCGSSVISVATDSSGHLVAAGAVDKKLYLLDRDGRALIEPVLLDDEVWSVAVSPAGDLIAAGTASKKPSRGTVNVVAPDGSLLLTDAAPGPVWGIAFSPDGQRMAAGTWTGDLYLYERTGPESLSRVGEWSNLAEAGLYGVAFTDDRHLAVAAYDVGLLRVDLDSRSVSQWDVRDGLYNIAVSADRDEVLVGTRSGTISTVVIAESGTTKEAARVSDRPVCGVAVSPTGASVATGSFDGYVRISDRYGHVAFAFQTPGEIWAVRFMASEQRIYAAGGDGRVHAWDLPLPTHQLESVMEDARLALADPKHHLSDFVRRCRYAGLGQYLASVVDVLPQIPELQQLEIVEALDALSAQEPTDGHLPFVAARLAGGIGRHLLAAARYQKAAASSPPLRSGALRRAATNALAAGYPLAADALLRRAQASEPSTEKLLVLYDLARSYEDAGELAAAATHLEWILSWDFGFLDTASRLEDIRAALRENARLEREIDYTGLTVSLLGSDVPRQVEVDEVLLPVVQARSSESRIDSRGRSRLNEAVRRMDDIGQLVDRGRGGLSYGLSEYLKYEYSPPEDDVKKHLEMAHLLAKLSESEIGNMLDVGTATCRYPQMFERLGVTATGVDISSDGYRHIRGRGSSFNRFVVGDAAALPFADQSFDVLTCMMGTFSHLSISAREAFLAEAHRVLRSSGLLVISDWNGNCDYQSFLTMYSTAEVTDLTHRATERDVLLSQMRTVGFSVSANDFCRFPDSFVTDTVVRATSPQDVERLIQLDLAMASRFPDGAGQMTMYFGEMPEFAGSTSQDPAR